MNKLDGKVAVITGGSSGIGLVTAQRFVDEAHMFSLQVVVKRSSIRQSPTLVKALPVFKVTCQSLMILIGMIKSRNKKVR